MNKYYKVVSILLEGRKESISQNTDVMGWDRENSLVYIPNEWTVPKIEGSALFVFNSLVNAEIFVRQAHFYCPVEIWECQVQNPRPAPGIIYVNIEHFWKKVKELKSKKKKISFSSLSNFLYCSEPPEGTIFCNKVKLTKLADSSN